LALVTVNTSKKKELSGKLVVLDVKSRSFVHEIDLGGQPDSVDISPDKKYAAITVENERPDSSDDHPQLPAGFLAVVDISNAADPKQWTVSEVGLTDLNDRIRFPNDPEPEFVHINKYNRAVVTLQENNGIVIVDLRSLSVVKAFSAGSVNLNNIDTIEDDFISPVNTQMNRRREPDGVTWIGNTAYFATANEGDLNGGGTRGFSIFNSRTGQVVYDSGNILDVLAIRHGHYPDNRSENAGNQPEGILYATYGTKSQYLFVASERANVVFVFDVSKIDKPVFKQVLPTSRKPEGLNAIPSRNLLVVACEDDDRDDKFRAGIVVYELQDADPTYPTIVSKNRRSVSDGNIPIPFSAISSIVHVGDDTMYAVEDNYYRKSRVLKIDTSKFPARVVGEMRVRDTYGIFASAMEGFGFDGLVNGDKTVNIDMEGISTAASGGFWVAHEGGKLFLPWPARMISVLIRHFTLQKLTRFVYDFCDA